MDDLRTALAEDLEGSFEALVGAWQQRLFAFALGLTGDASDAEEIAQDALVRAHRALGGWDADRIRALHLSAWLHTVTLNAFRNRARVRRLRLVPLEGAAELADGRSGPEESVLRGARLAALRAELAALPRAQREAVVLRHVQGLSYAEAAEVLGRPPATLRSDVHRALAVLRRRIEYPEVLRHA